jgi:DNA-binding SARP family transcriptional activator
VQKRWRIELLGRLRATQGDRVVTRFRARKTGVLFAYLAHHLDRPHPREQLIELLWPEAGPRSGRSGLSRELTSLRRQLEPPGYPRSGWMPAGTVIIADRDTVQLNPAACVTDVHAFETALQHAARARSGGERIERLTEAVELYHGELLPGYFEDWILAERQRLLELVLHALDELTAQLEQAGDHPGAIQCARRAVLADPMREEGHHALIRLLRAAGQPAAALRQYHELERLLAKGLGLAPDPETHALVREIERGPVTADPVCFPEAPAIAAVDALPAAGPSTEPTGTITFLLAQFDPQGTLDSEHDRLQPLHRQYGSYDLGAGNSAFLATFGRASDALAAASTMYRHCSSRSPQPGSLPRLALHTAEVPSGRQAQHSSGLQHAARLLLAAHPGQFLVSEKSAVLLRDVLEPGVHLLDRGLYRLRDTLPPERLFQLCFPAMPAREFPPPNALPAHEGSLPLQLDRFFGREEEINRLCELLAVPVNGGRNDPQISQICADKEKTVNRSVSFRREARGEGREERLGPSLVSRLSPLASRLVTLTGPGGSGKTRLALEVAGRHRAAFHGAVWFVPLQDLIEARLITDKLLEALRLPRSPQLQPLEQAVAFLARQPSLVVLDNFEHLVTEGAPLVQALLEQVPTLTCLVTSRQRLNLAGEKEFPVAPLPAPDPSRDREGAVTRGIR